MWSQAMLTQGVGALQLVLALVLVLDQGAAQPTLLVFVPFGAAASKVGVRLPPGVVVFQHIIISESKVWLP
jgi:hypothetical protein